MIAMLIRMLSINNSLMKNNYIKLLRFHVHVCKYRHTYPCGSHKHMGVVLARGFVFSDVCKHTLVFNVRGATRYVTDRMCTDNHLCVCV